jgi:hypothetical protein
VSDKIVDRIKRKQCDVFLRKDFNDLGDYDQVGRILHGLVKKGQVLEVDMGSIRERLPPRSGLCHCHQMAL